MQIRIHLVHSMQKKFRIQNITISLVQLRRRQ